MPGNCHFQEKWLVDEQFKNWLRKDKKDTMAAFCSVCRKNIDISSMGRTALTSHLKGKKHTELSHSKTSDIQTLDSFVNSSSSVSGLSKLGNVNSSSSDASISMSNHVSKTDVLNAEVWWSLKTINSNQSFSSNTDTVYVFQQMFTDSDIVKGMKLAETKTMYLSCFGIAPYFTSMLEKKVKGTPYVMLFDETLNRELQKKQLDIFMRFWDHDIVASRYYISDFLGHGCATDLIQSFESCVEKRIGLCNIVQLSMDGPNVNWATFDKLDKKLYEDNGKKLLDIGSCGLHIMHNAFKAAVTETGWDMSHRLSALHTLFSDVPARREDYELITKQSLYPLNFCAHRWVENVMVCGRAIEVLPHMITYIESVKSKKVKSPGTKSYQTVVEFCNDPFAIAKLGFIISVGKPVETFLKYFQSDKPMVPFLAKKIEILMRDIMNRFIKPDIMASATTTQKLTSVSVTEKENQKHTSKVDLGFVADQELKKIIAVKKVSERALMEFKAECRLLLEKLVSKFSVKSPLTKSLVRNLTCLMPKEICKYPEECISKFKRVLTYLVSCNYLDIKECDDIQRQFEHFLQDSKHLKEFKDFSQDVDRLDKLFFDTMNGQDKYSNVWSVVRILLLLSHGQASVERGFSVNKEVSEYNLSEHNLVAQRVIKDYINHVGGLKGVVITKELLQSAQCARQKYQSYLDAQQVEKARKIQSEKRKVVEDEVESIRKKQKQLKSDIESLNESANRNMEKAEEKQSLTFVTKGNALRRRAKEKEEEFNAQGILLDEKTLLKNL